MIVVDNDRAGSGPTGATTSSVGQVLWPSRPTRTGWS